MTNPPNWKKNIGLFMAGQGITLFGSMLVHYAVMWHITLTTQSGLMMMLTTMAGALPMFFVSPFGGVWADRFKKKNIINLADGAIALVTLGMAVVFSFGMEHMSLLLLCLAIRAVGQGIQTPAVNALTPELVPQEHLTRVNGISGSIQSLVMFASPLAGAGLLAIAPIQTILFLDVITAAIGISVLAFFVKTPAQAPKGQDLTGGKQYFLEMGEGLRYVNKQSFVKKFLVISALFNIMVAPSAVLTPLQVARDWGDSVWTILGGFPVGPENRLAGLELAFFLGMMLGGLVMGTWGGFKNRSHSMALSTCLYGVGSMGLGLLDNYWLYLVCVLFTGLVVSLFNAPMMATLQINIDPAYMGRVFSVMTMISSLMMPLGMILWGPLGDVVAIDYLLIGTGAFLILLGLVFVFDKTLLKAGGSTGALPQTPPGE